MAQVDTFLSTLKAEEAKIAAAVEKAMADHPLVKQLKGIRQAISAYINQTGTAEAPKVAAAPARSPARSKPVAKPSSGKMRGRPPSPEKVDAITKAAEAHLRQHGSAHPKDLLGAVQAAGITVSKERPAHRLQAILVQTGKFAFERGKGFSLKTNGVGNPEPASIDPPVGHAEPATAEAVA